MAEQLGMAQLGIESEFDSQALTSKDEYALYFRLIHHVLQCFLKVQPEISRAATFTPQEITLTEQYFTLLIQTLTAFRLRYLYDTDHNLKIDKSESGFPNNREFMFLINDLRIKDEQITALPSKEEIQERMLNYLFDQRQMLPKEMMQQGALVEFYSRYSQSNIYNRFVNSKLLQSDLPGYPYMVSWSFYDSALNRPFIYFMYFTYTGENLEVDKEKIFDVIRSNGQSQRQLAITASLIDKELVNVHPKFLKSIEIGPLYSVFSRDDNPLTHVIMEGITQQILSPKSFALQLNIDVLQSGGEKKITDGSLFFKKNQSFQQYIVPSNNKTAQQRGATNCYSFMLAPHRVVQHINTMDGELTKVLSNSPFIIPELEDDNNYITEKKL